MKIMKYMLPALLCCSMHIQGVQAADNGPVWSWETQFRSEYLGKIGVVFYDKPIMVNDISLFYKDFYVGMWNSTALGGEPYGSTFGDEFDLYAGWGHTYGWVHLQFSAAYFAIKDLNNLRDDLWIFEPEISFPKVPFVQPYVAVRSFNPITSESPERGWFVWTGLRRDQQLGFNIGSEPAKLSIEWMNAYSDGALHRDPGWVFTRFSAAFKIPVNKHLMITPGILYQLPIGGQENHPRPYTTENEVVGQVSLRWTF